MKILFLGEPTSPNTMSWVKGLKDQGCEVTIASARSDGNDGAIPIGPKSLHPYLRIFFGVGNLKKIIHEIKPDILIAYHLTSYGYMAAKTGFKPLVTAAMNEQIIHMPTPSFFKKLLLPYFTRYAIKHSDLIHAWGDNVRQGLLSFGADDKKILVLHRGINLDNFSQPKQRVFNKEKPVFVSTRSLYFHYHIDKVIRAFRKVVDKIPKAELRIIGDGPEKQSLQNLSKELNLDQNITFEGRLKPEEMNKILSKAHIYISVIRTEGVSSSLLEVCATGLLPVVADIPSSRDIVKDGENGLLIPDLDPENISKFMVRSVESYNKIAPKLKNNSDQIHQRFDRNKNQKVFIDKYNELVGYLNDIVQKHICHIATSHSSADIRIFSRECVGLAKKGYRVSLVARHPKKETIDGVEIIPLDFAGKFSRKFYLPFIALKKALATRADILHFHDPELLPYMFWAAKFKKIKVIWDVHELYTERIKEFTFKDFPIIKNISSFLFDKIELTCCKSFAGIIPVTDALLQRYEDINPNCQVIKNVVDLDAVSPLCDQKKMDKDKFTIIASGTANEGRCIKNLIKAFSILQKNNNNTILKLIATFESPSYEKEVKELIESLNLKEKTTIKDLVPWQKLMTEEIPSCNLGMVLYSFESQNNLVALPNRLFEYWAGKLPVVVSGTPLLKKIIAEAKGGMCIEDNNPENIANAISFYINNPGKAINDGNNGKNEVINKYLWSHELETLSDFYKKILAD